MEKELVFVRKVKGGIPKSIDDIFENKVKLSEDNYKYGVVSTTADGASVNFGKYRALMTRMKSGRDKLVSKHYVAHRSELSLKDSLLKAKEFKKLDDLMIGLYNLHKRSGKLKRSMRCDAKTLGIDAYVLPKVTSTRFVCHRLMG